jgi:CubicO group peptidase (beta-lactamase class C family)
MMRTDRRTFLAGAAGRLSLDDPVERDLPEGFLVSGRVTLGQLATQTSGLPPCRRDRGAARV